MEKIALSIEGSFLIHARFFCDDRGFFVEKYRSSAFDIPFVQDNHSFSHFGVIRGMHMHKRPVQAKLVQVIVGKIYDVIVDMRPYSLTYKKWVGVEIGTQELLYIPPGCAHGFCVLSNEGAHVMYKVSTFYSADDEVRFRYDDPEIGIAWPPGSHILSELDATAPHIKDLYAPV